MIQVRNHKYVKLGYLYRDHLKHTEQYILLMYLLNFTHIKELILSSTLP